MKISPSLCVLPMLLTLVGCKPKENDLSGQAFVVSGNENIKLGLAEVRLIPKKEVVEFLNRKLPVIGSEISKRNHEINEAIREKKAVQDEVDTDPGTKVYRDEKGNWIGSTISSKELSKKLDAAEARLKAAASMANEAFPSPELYFEDSAFPKGIQKIFADADGKFWLKYPNDRAFTLFAKSERTIDNNVVKLFWLVDVPTNHGARQILLSNQNIVYVDPDGYFKISTNSFPDVGTAKPQIAR